MTAVRCVCHGRMFPTFDFHNGLIKHYEDVIKGKNADDFKWKEKYEDLKQQISKLVIA